MRELIGIMRTTTSTHFQEVMTPNMVLNKQHFWDIIVDAATSQDFPGLRQVWNLRVCQDPEVFWRYFYFKWSANKPRLMSLIHFDKDPAGRVTKLTARLLVYRRCRSRDATDWLAYATGFGMTSGSTASRHHFTEKVTYSCSTPLGVLLQTLTRRWLCTRHRTNSPTTPRCGELTALCSWSGIWSWCTLGLVSLSILTIWR
jgi:hypothetical protein